LLGNATGEEGQTGSVDSGAQAGIADQFFGRRETLDVADGTENDQCGHYANAGRLDQVGPLLKSGIGQAQAMQLVGGFIDQGIELVEHH